MEVTVQLVTAISTCWLIALEMRWQKYRRADNHTLATLVGAEPYTFSMATRILRYFLTVIISVIGGTIHVEGLYW